MLAGADMELLANDLSVHEQFHDKTTFYDALSRLMTMRCVAQHFALDIYCHRGFLNAKPMPGVSMQQAIGSLSDRNTRRATMVWLTCAGPFWDDVHVRQHDVNDWLECRGKIVTDSAIGEAGFRTLHGVNCGLVSVSPSAWNFAAVKMIWCRGSQELDNQSAALENWWDPEELENGLRNTAPLIRSWRDLYESSTSRFQDLTFAENCFMPLKGIPFARSASDRFFQLLSILDQFARAFNVHGTRTPEGHQIYRDYFTGDNALFSDSSDSEKHKFR